MDRARAATRIPNRDERAVPNDCSLRAAVKASTVRTASLGPREGAEEGCNGLRS